MSSFTLLLLQLVLMGSSVTAGHAAEHSTSNTDYWFYGGSVTFSPKPKVHYSWNGTYEVELRIKLASCKPIDQKNDFSCSYGDCGCQINSTITRIDDWCLQELVMTRRLHHDKPFEIRYPKNDSDLGHLNYFGSSPAHTFSMRARVDLGTRSDTRQSNRSPITTIIHLIRVHPNCPRTLNLTVFDPDGDQVRCSYATSQTQGLILDQNSCSLSYNYSISQPVVELVLEDFPREQISVSYNDGSSTPKHPLSIHPSSIHSLSKIPLHFTLVVEPDAPSCHYGDYSPMFLSPTPPNGHHLPASVNNTLEILVRATALYSRIYDLQINGPTGISKLWISNERYIIRWTPTDNELNQHFSICFVFESENTVSGNAYQSELRCVISHVGLGGGDLRHPRDNETTTETPGFDFFNSEDGRSGAGVLIDDNEPVDNVKADIVFLVDGSGSISPDDFRMIRQFLHSFIDGLAIGSDRVRVGLAQYSRRPQAEFLLKDTTDKRSLLERVDRLRQMHGSTATGQGITFLQSVFFTKEAGSRVDDGVPQIAVVITDGKSHDDVVRPSQLLRNQGVIMFAIGVGNNVNVNELMSMASQPHEKFLIEVLNFQGLQNLTDSVLQTVREISLPITPACEKQADLVMLIDQSNSTDPSNYTVMKTFMTDLVSSFNVSEEFVRVGVAQFSSSLQEEFYLNEFHNETAVNNRILTMTQLGGGSTRNIGRALASVQDYFHALRGSRKSQSISQTLLLITAGRSQDCVDEAAANLRVQGVEVFAVGIGDPGDLALITGSPDRIFTVQNFSSLADIKQEVVGTICNSTYVPDRPETTVHCNETSMTVVVLKSYLIQHNWDKLHLIDDDGPSCNLTTHSNLTHLIAVVPMNGCGSTLEEDQDDLIFWNVITSANTSRVITRTCDVQITFSCAYPKRANLTVRAFTHKSPSAFTERGYGNFSLQLEFFENKHFSQQISARSYPVKVSLKQRIYMSIDVNSTFPGTELFVESCKATPYDNPNSPMSYTIIENGCARDNTMRMYSGPSSQFRFGMEAFEFIGAHEEVYISCSVMLCQTGTPGSRCSQGCISGNQRAKRDANAQTSTHYISQGPLHLISDDGSRGSGLNADLSVILLSMAGCVLVCGLVLYHSRRARVQYQALPTSDFK